MSYVCLCVWCFHCPEFNMSKSLKPSLHLARLEYKINNENVEGTIAVDW